MLLKNKSSLHFKAFETGNIFVYRNGSLYFERPFFLNTLFYINIPFSGNYSFSGYGFKYIGKTTLIYKKINFDLPKPERVRIPIVNDIKIDDTSKSPAKIATRYGVISINNAFLKLPCELKYFILLHEYGHFYYKTEHFCDLFAAYHFLKEGCNPTQSFAALAEVLHPSEANQERIKKIYNILKK